METLSEQETKAILAMGEKIKELERLLEQANDRVRQLESQVYGGSTHQENVWMMIPNLNIPSVDCKKKTT